MSKIPNRRHRAALTQAQAEAAALAYTSGSQTVAQLAARYGLSLVTIYKYLRLAGVPRSPGASDPRRYT